MSLTVSGCLKQDLHSSSSSVCKLRLKRPKDTVAVVNSVDVSDIFFFLLGGGEGGVRGAGKGGGTVFN